MTPARNSPQAIGTAIVTVQDDRRADGLRRVTRRRHGQEWTEQCAGAHTLVFDVFTKVPSRIAAALCAGNRCRSPDSCETRDPFDATVTVNVALSMDWGFQTLTVSWSPAASGHIPL